LPRTPAVVASEARLAPSIATTLQAARSIEVACGSWCVTPLGSVEMIKREVRALAQMTSERCPLADALARLPGAGGAGGVPPVAEWPEQLATKTELKDAILR
jgi:hypothetical protein